MGEPGNLDKHGKIAMPQMLEINMLRVIRSDSCQDNVFRETGEKVSFCSI